MADQQVEAIYDFLPATFAPKKKKMQLVMKLCFVWLNVTAWNFILCRVCVIKDFALYVPFLQSLTN